MKKRSGVSKKYGRRLYLCYIDMMKRCYNPKSINYKYYGAIGISVCDEWADYEKGLDSFCNWALKNGYSDDLTIDRIDTTKDYSPDNCRWADKTTQCVNRKSIGECEYVGVSLHHNKSCYVAYVMAYGKLLFLYSNRSKNTCAKARNEFIISHNLPHRLNEIKEEYEDIRKHKNDNRFYVAENKETGEIIKMHLLKDLTKKLGLSKTFISECISGKRNSKKYVFRREVN